MDGSPRAVARQGLRRQKQMSIAFDIMFWPLVACLLLPGILIYYGLHIVRREIIFVDLALAQVAALGTCLSLMLGHEPNDMASYVLSLGFTFVGALLFALTRSEGHKRVPQEALIGIVYVVAAAASIVLLSKGPAHANEELKRTLVGEVLNVTKTQVWKTFALYAAIAIVHFIFRKQFLAVSFEPERAAREGLAVRWWDFLFPKQFLRLSFGPERAAREGFGGRLVDFLFYALFGLVVTSFVQIGGVL